MKAFDISPRRRAAWLRRIGTAFLVSGLAAGCVTSARADPPPPKGAPAQTSITAWAMRWFREMQAGRTDRSQYAAAYRMQVTDAAVKAMSHALNRYGAPPLHAEVIQTRKIGEQTFYAVKYVFPRGDATSLLFGFDPAGKITGIGVGGLAGD